jgi:hypothetical protein
MQAPQTSLRVVEQMPVTPKVAGSNLVPDDFFHSEPFILAAVSFVGTWGGVLGSK